MWKNYSHLERWRTDFNLPPSDIQGKISTCARPSARWEIKPHRTTNVAVTYWSLVGPSPDLRQSYSRQTWEVSRRTKVDCGHNCPNVTVPTTSLTRARSSYADGSVLPLLSLKKVTQCYIPFANIFVSLLSYTQCDLHCNARGAGCCVTWPWDRVIKFVLFVKRD